MAEAELDALARLVIVALAADGGGGGIVVAKSGFDLELFDAILRQEHLEVAQSVVKVSVQAVGAKYSSALM